MKENLKNRYKIGLGIAILLIIGMPMIALADPPYTHNGYFRSDGKITEYYFNEGSGICTRNDAGDSSNNGTIVNAVWTQEQEDHQYGSLSSIDAALYFDGDGDYVEVPGHDDFNIGWKGPNAYTFAISAKIKTDSEKENIVICSYTIGTDGWIFGLENGNLYFKYYVGVNLCTISDYSSLHDDQWHFVIVQRENDGYHLYVDPYLFSFNETAFSNSNTDPPDAVTGTNFYIGTIGGSENNYYDFEGIIDNLHIYQTPPNPYWKMFGGGSNAYWSMDEGSGNDGNTIINDRIDCDFHAPSYNSYGEISENNAYFTDEGAVGSHQLKFGEFGMGYATVYDEGGSRLDFANSDLFIDFRFKHANQPIRSIEPLISKLDVPYGSITNGYIIYLTNERRLVMDCYSGGFLTSTIMSNINAININVAYRVWCYPIGNTMYIHWMSESGGPWSTSGSFGGIGATSSHLYLGASPNYPGGSQYYSGTMDEVIYGCIALWT